MDACYHIEIGVTMPFQFLVMVLIVKAGEREIVYAKGEEKLGWQEERVSGIVTARASSPGFYFVWPLVVGKSWEYNYAWEGIQARRTEVIARRCTIEATETVKVPAGTFETFRVVCRNNAGKVAFTHWFSDTVKMYVKQRAVFSFGTEIRELTAYKLR